MATALATLPVKTPSLPRAVISALTTNLEWDPRRALAEIGPHAGDLDRLIDIGRQSLVPVNGGWLNDRLCTMQLAMTQGWSDAKATAWLHETRRLLSDIPVDILGPAIDEAVKASARGFVPSVGEIRAYADPKLAERKRVVSRLEALAHVEPRSQREPEPVDRCPPEAVAEILAEFGLKRLITPAAERPTGPRRMPTAEDYRAMGIDIA